VSLEEELDWFPVPLESGNKVLHLSLVLGLISDLLDIFLVVAKFELKDELELEGIVDLELHTEFLLKFVPMSISHLVRSKLFDHTQEVDPHLDVVLDTNGSVGSLVDLDFFECFSKLVNNFKHLINLDLSPERLLEFVELVVAFGDMIPEGLHNIDRDLDGINIFVTFDDEVRLSEFFSVFTEVSNLRFECGKLFKDTVQLGFCLIRTAGVLVEFSLLHLLGELSDGFLELLDVASVSFLLVSNERFDLLRDFLGHLLKLTPVLANLGELFDLLILDQLAVLEELDSLVKLINLESNVVLFSFDHLGVLHDASKLLNIFKILLSIFGVDVSLIVTKVGGKTINLFGNVVLHDVTGQSVVLWVTSLNNVSPVWATSKRNHFELVVLE
jgi:hypothetical protein